MIKILLSAGEASGDLHAAALTKAILALEPTAEIYGMGGEAMRAAGGEVVFDIKDHENRGAAVRTIEYLQELLKITATESMVNAHYKVNTRNINDEVSPRMRPGDAVTQYLMQLSHVIGLLHMTDLVHQGVI